MDFEVPDLAAAVAFYTEVWGLECWRREADSAWLHGTGDDAYLLALHAAETPSIRQMTFRARSEADLHLIADRIDGSARRSSSPSAHDR